ncbi:hypothetical protein B0A50_03355 [Salinomyces thailandicus]|uniref:Swi5-domain-containing protein n=1 Tax=Salinomyces thailandicus TaxID=706561 RepID=A0A4U0U2G1_9PEZI|nr:hypothetical protein B0A50_03355 [Salinomyces thailandica]
MSHPDPTPNPQHPTPQAPATAPTSTETTLPLSHPERQTPTLPPANPRLTALLKKQSALKATLSTLQAQLHDLATSNTSTASSSSASPEQQTQEALATAREVINEHIRRLHKYNEMRDVGLGVAGLVAEMRGVRVGGVLEELGVGDGD